ncbi:NUDIX domain-containing protein [Cytobacillus spongiae]|uniref:NUDIX domain-containing protein n=1 Tax=Cytobacillus spongiae TaxID=2901381 RepID=UPI001F32DC44|nr:NUDIX domain-containing protein [Cytobacillus spongiae]UII57581.1 NUDIX domain-containing protein [Cytobacillus spongiae]
MNIRNSAKAIIIKENQLLLTKNVDEEGFFYLYPGGGQEHGETLHQAVVRECIEETGSRVEAQELVFVREYIGKNHEHAHFDSKVHQVEFYFRCQLIEHGETPHHPDSHQVGMEWVPMEELSEIRVYPKELSKFVLARIRRDDASVYLGDIN